LIIFFIVVIPVICSLLFKKLQELQELQELQNQSSTPFIVIFILHCTLIVFWILATYQLGNANDPRKIMELNKMYKYKQCHPMYDFVYKHVNTEKNLQKAKDNPKQTIDHITNHSMFRRCFEQDPNFENKKQELETTILNINSVDESYKFADKFKTLFPECNYNECKLNSYSKSLRGYYRCHPFYQDFDNEVGGFDTLSDALDRPNEIVDYLFEKHKDCIAKHDNIEEKKNQLKQIIPKLKTPYESYKFSMTATEMFPKCNTNICA
jgi:hypothetical protein